MTDRPFDSPEPYEQWPDEERIRYLHHHHALRASASGTGPQLLIVDELARLTRRVSELEGSRHVHPADPPSQLEQCRALARLVLGYRIEDPRALESLTESIAVSVRNWLRHHGLDDGVLKDELDHDLAQRLRAVRR